MAEGSNPQQAGISIIRVFDAPRERVWREWTEPERFADWFGGTDSEVPLSSVSMDVTAGGAWRAMMFSGPDRRESRWTGEYQEVIEPERLVLTVSDQPGGEQYETRHRGSHRPRRRPDRDALRAARAHGSPAVQASRAGLVVLLRPGRRAWQTRVRAFARRRS